MGEENFTILKGKQTFAGGIFRSACMLSWFLVNSDLLSLFECRDSYKKNFYEKNICNRKITNCIFQSKSMDWFLYDSGLRYESVNVTEIIVLGGWTSLNQYASFKSLCKHNPVEKNNKLPLLSFTDNQNNIPSSFSKNFVQCLVWNVLKNTCSCPKSFLRQKQ